MEVREFLNQVPDFAGLNHPEKILHFGWFLHHHRKQERFDLKALRACYDAADIQPPNLSEQIRRLLDKRPRVLLEDGVGYRLEMGKRRALDAKYAEHETTIVVSRILADLPGKINDEAERKFLSEALKCYKVEAFRAVVIMAWNLAYDHLLRWILADPVRVSTFNSRIIGVVGAKRGAGLVMAKREDFEELTERNVVDISGPILPSGNIKTILTEQLNRRNLAAHPTLVDIERPQADDTITTLVNNVVLKLS
jgi:hypothetical protein